MDKRLKPVSVAEIEREGWNCFGIGTVFMKKATPQSACENEHGSVYKNVRCHCNVALLKQRCVLLTRGYRREGLPSQVSPLSVKPKGNAG